MKAANLSLAAGITILMLPGILRTAEPELVTLSAEGEAKMVIAIPEGSEPIRKTAIQLQDMLRRISGADFEITTEAKSGPAIRLQIAKHPLSPPAAPVQGRLQGPPAKSKFLAAPLKAPASERQTRNSAPRTSFIRAHIEDRMAREAVAFMERNKDKPFFLNYWMFSVHAPFDAKKDLIEKYRGLIDPKDPQRSPTYAAMVESMQPPFSPRSSGPRAASRPSRQKQIPSSIRPPRSKTLPSPNTSNPSTAHLRIGKPGVTQSEPLIDATPNGVRLKTEAS